MKRKVRLTHTVELVVEAETEDKIYEFLTEHTPSEAKELAESYEESYDEEILDGIFIDDNRPADYKISNSESFKPYLLGVDRDKCNACDVAKKIWAEIDVAWSERTSVCEFFENIAELKKKYTED